MLYTRKGDSGTSGILGKERFPKDALLFQALGTLDELNAYIGVCRAHSDESEITLICEELQQHLFIIQAELAGSDKRIEKSHITRLEEITDTIERALPPIKSFFLPGAITLSAHLDYARTVARRAERCIASLHNEQELSAELSSYINRISSVLYALARLASHRSGVEEKKPHY